MFYNCQQIQVVSSSQKLADWAVTQLADTGVAVIEDQLQADNYCILHNCRDAKALVLHVLEGIAPFSPPVIHEPALEPGTVLIELAGDAGQVLDLSMRVESEFARRDLESTVSGLPITSTEMAQAFEGANLDQSNFYPDELKIFHGKLNSFNYHLMLWLSQRHGQYYQVLQSDRLADGMIRIDWPDPRYIDKPARERLTFLVTSDCPSAARQILESLRAAGFRAEISTESATDKEHFTLFDGTGVASDHGDVLLEVQVLLEQQLVEQGLSADDFPIKMDAQRFPGGDQQVQINWPIRAARSGQLVPYAGRRKERFSVRVHSDDDSLGIELTRRVMNAGFAGAEISTAPGSTNDFLLRYPKVFPNAFRLELYQLLRDLMDEKNIPSEYFLTVDERDSGPLDDDEDYQVDIFFPLEGVFDGRRVPTLQSPRGKWDVTVYLDDSAAWGSLLSELRAWGFEDFSVNEDEDEKLGRDDMVRIAYGGAPEPLLERIKCFLEQDHDLGPIKLDKRWGDHDDDIWIYLPRRKSTEPEDSGALSGSEKVQDIPEDLSEGFAIDTIRFEQRPWLVRGASELFFGDRRIDRKTADTDGLAPDFGGFSHFCLDQQTVETLDFVAESIELGEPCLLEGDTATSKTSSILFAAACIGQPVLRLNLHGQTDTGELVGRFAPATTSSRRFESLRGLQGDETFLEQRSREILAKAREEQRELTSAELAKVASLEGQPVLQWAWIEGAVLTAMRKGWWLLLDELNLAEPQILERLNSLLEQPPSLVVSEFDNRVYGGKGRPIAQGFQMFATMNPASYAGRTSLSPAYRSRWLAHRIVPTPDESGFQAMLDLLVFGRQPGVELHGVRWAGSQVNPMFPALAQIPGMQDWLEALGRFHAALCRPAVSAGGSDSGVWSSRRDAHVFSRRTLLSVLSFVVQFSHGCTSVEDVRTIFRRAVQRYYLDPVDDGNEKSAIVDLMQATGLQNLLSARLSEIGDE